MSPIRLKSIYARSKAALSGHLLLLLVAAWPLLFYYRAAIGSGIFYFGDIARFFYPTRVLYAQALANGRLPLWTPDILLGFPLFAEMQTGALYPPHLLLYRFLPLPLALNYDILLHLAWLAAGTFLFARGRRLGAVGAAITALAFSAGGFGVARVTHMSVLAVAAWLPWSLLLYDRWRRHPSAGRFLLLAFVWGLQFLGGHPQFMLLNALTFTGYLLGAAIGWLDEHGQEQEAAPPTLSRGRSMMLALLPALTVVLGAGLAAVQLLPTAELAQASARAGGVTEAFFTDFSFNPLYLGLWLDPFLLGNPYPRISVEVVAYFGALPLLLAVLAAFLLRHRRETWFWLALSAVCFLLALGGFNPLYHLLRHVPLFNFFRVPARFLFPLSLAVAILAGTGFQAFWDRLRGEETTRPTLILGLVGALAVGAIIALTPVLGSDAWLQVWAVLPFLFWALALGVVLAAWRRYIGRQTLSVLAVGLTLVDLAAFAAVYAQTFNAIAPAEQVFAPPRVLPSLQLADGARILTSEWMFPWVSEMRESLYPNQNAAYGVPAAHGYTPLVPQRTSDVLSNLSPKLLNLLGVRYFMVPQVIPVDAKSEASDLDDPFMLHPVGEDLAFEPTRAQTLEVESSLAQSVNLKDGDIVAQIDVSTETGQTIRLPLRAGLDTAEWAYERPDVSRAIMHSEPPVASTFPARSAFPVQEHLGHTFRGTLSLGMNPVTVVGIKIEPTVPAGLLYIQRLTLKNGANAVDVAQLLGKGSHHLVYRSEDVAVFENPDYAPRAWLTHNAVRVSSDQEALQRLTSPDYSGELLLAAGEPTGSDAGQMLNERVTIVDYQPEHVAIDVEANAGGYLVLADAWDAGWVATVDGRPASIDRADVLLRAVPIDGGHHRVEFSYRPYSLYLGAAITVITLILLAIIACTAWLWPRRQFIALARRPVI